MRKTLRCVFCLCFAFMLTGVQAGLAEEDADPAALNEAVGQIGNIVPFGCCEQDNNRANGMEPIEWIVLEVQDGRALLLSRYGLDARPFHAKREETAWEGSTLRAWLNGEFLSAAFDEDERNAILAANADNPGSLESGGRDENGATGMPDRVFLLSDREARQLFRDDEARKCVPTEYALKQGAYTSISYKVDGRDACWWWLRNTYPDLRHAAVVGISGTFGSGSLRDSSVAVRPAMWVKLEALSP